jgi:hypothetical protein
VGQTSNGPSDHCSSRQQSKTYNPLPPLWASSFLHRAGQATVHPAVPGGNGWPGTSPTHTHRRGWQDVLRCKKLVARGEDINEALHYAIGRGRLEIVSVFIQVCHYAHCLTRRSLLSVTMTSTLACPHHLAPSMFSLASHSGLDTAPIIALVAILDSHQERARTMYALAGWGRSSHSRPHGRLLSARAQ